MSIRFRRSIPLGGGIKLNLNKKISEGVKGLYAGIGSKGLYSNLGIPETGLYAANYSGKANSNSKINLLILRGCI